MFRLVHAGQLVKDDLFVRGGVIIDGQDWFYSTKKKATRVVDCKVIFFLLVR